MGETQLLQSQAKESTHCFGALLLGSIIADVLRRQSSVQRDLRRL
jgi:hypothetical protein